jgi:hypothetical protein
MGWGKSPSASSSVGAGAFAADYNRSYDTHTSHTSNTAFAVNPPSYPDTGPYEVSGLGTDKQARAYKSPINFEPDQALHGSPYGYLGDQDGPREIQTGNAPSGGYSTRPGLGFTAGGNGIVGINPDRRRIRPGNRSDDWEDNQAQIHYWRDRELRFRRAENVQESWVQYDTLPKPVTQVNAHEDSPYRKDWPDQHMGPGGQPGSATYRKNPNTFRNFDRQFFASNYATGAGARYNNGTHYSMAVHQTLTPYGPSTDGANPVRASRNTYRIDPAPWDTTNTDGPSNTASYATTLNLSGGGSNGSPSYRL